MAAPDPLPSADLGLVDAVVQFAFAVQSVITQVATAHGLSVTQLRLLGVLRDREPTMLELARFLELEKSSVTGLVDRAQRRGHVTRTAGPRDGRSVHVALTEAGRRLADDGAAQVTAELSGLLVDLEPRDRADLSLLASRLVHRHAAVRGIDLDTGAVAGRPVT